MQNEFANRHNMHLSILRLLDSGEHQLVWKDKAPTAFTSRAEDLRPKVDALTTLISKQQTDTTGHAADKAREEKELETAAHEIGQILAGWFEDQGRHADAVTIDLSLSAWQRLRDTELLAKARLLHEKLTAALAADAASLAEYGLAPEDAALLDKETKDYEAIIADGNKESEKKQIRQSKWPNFRQKLKPSNSKPNASAVKGCA